MRSTCELSEHSDKKQALNNCSAKDNQLRLAAAASWEIKLAEDHCDSTDSQLPLVDAGANVNQMTMKAAGLGVEGQLQVQHLLDRRPHEP